MTTFDYNNEIYTEYLENDKNWGDDEIENENDSGNGLTHADRERLSEQHLYNMQRYVRDTPIQTVSVSVSTDEEGKTVHFNKLKWYEIIIFLAISMSLFRPGYILDKFYPEFENINLAKNELLISKFNPDKETHIKITRQTEYGDRYKLIVIEKSSFQNEFNLEDYGINLSQEDQILRVDTLKWNGLAKKSGFETGDIITEVKTENLMRPNKSIIYPFSIILLILFGFMNYKRKSN